MRPSLLLQGQLHRPRYEGGGVLKCTVFAENTKVATEATDKPIPYAPAVLSPSARAATSAAAAHEAPADDTSASVSHAAVGEEVFVERIMAQIIGTVAVDSSRIVCPRGTFGGDFMGAGTAHTEAATAGAAAAQKGGGGGFLGGLFSGWRRGAASPADQPAVTTGAAAETAGAASSSLEAALPLSLGPLMTTTAHAIGASSAASRREETHTIFATPVALLASGVRMRRGDVCTAVLRCDLPPRLPPSFAGYCARYYYAVHVVCEYSAYSSSSAAASSSSLSSHAASSHRRRFRSVLRIPIRVDSLVATNVIIRSPYVLTTSAPLSAANADAPARNNSAEESSANAGGEIGSTNTISSSGSNGFDYAMQHTFMVSNGIDFLKPSPVLAPPIDDALFCGAAERQRRRDSGHAQPSSASSSAIAQPSMSGGRPAPQPYEVGGPSPLSLVANPKGGQMVPAPCVHLSLLPASDPLAEADYPVRVTLWGTTVRLGDQLRGVFRCSLPQPSSSSHPSQDDSVCFRAIVTLETIEAAPRAFFRQGSVIPKDSEDAAGFIAANCAAVEEQEFYLSHSASQLPFAMPLTGPRCQQTSRTDVVSNQWRLRIVFYFASARAIAAGVASSGEASVVPAIERLQEVVVPLTVLPPVAPRRLGPMVHSDVTVPM